MSGRRAKRTPVTAQRVGLPSRTAPSICDESSDDARVAASPRSTF